MKLLRHLYIERFGLGQGEESLVKLERNWKGMVSQTPSEEGASIPLCRMLLGDKDGN